MAFGGPQIGPHLCSRTDLWRFVSHHTRLRGTDVTNAGTLLAGSQIRTAL